jgi:hypothetical protein
MSTSAIDLNRRVFSGWASKMGEHITTFIALMLLFAVQAIVRMSSFHVLCTLVKRWPVIGTVSNPTLRSERILRAFDRAVKYTLTDTFCLRRAAATVCALRLFGVPAHLLIVVRRIPFSAHSCVEINGEIVDQLPVVDEGLRIIDRM